MALGFSLASVATTSLPWPARRATSRRISARPSFSSWPPMMTRLPLAVIGCPPARRPGCPDGLGGVRRRRFRSGLLAMQLHLPIAVLEKPLGHGEPPGGYHALAASEHVDRLE